MDLYSSDGSHPSFLGSYVAAVCFYTTLFQKNPLNIPWNEELNVSESDSELINEVVKIVLYDDLENWYIVSNDIDNDGVCNNSDNCPYDYNPNQEDFDLDNVGDICDDIEVNEVFHKKQLIKTIDLLGRDNVNYSLLLYIYSDGSVEKKYLIR